LQRLLLTRQRRQANLFGINQSFRYLIVFLKCPTNLACFGEFIQRPRFIERQSHLRTIAKAIGRGVCWLVAVSVTLTVLWVDRTALSANAGNYGSLGVPTSLIRERSK
jgi:hypothetical protein